MYLIQCIHSQLKINNVNLIEKKYQKYKFSRKFLSLKNFAIQIFSMNNKLLLIIIEITNFVLFSS